MARQRWVVGTGVLLVIAVVGAGVLLLRVFVNLSDEARAAKAIEKLGGKVRVDENAPGRPVVGVHLHGTSATDTDMKQLKELKNLRVLWLSGTKVTDAGLKELKELKSLQALELDKTKVTDAGLKELKALTSLKNLRLGDTKVTDAGIKELQAALPELQINR